MPAACASPLPPVDDYKSQFRTMLRNASSLAALFRRAQRCVDLTRRLDGGEPGPLRATPALLDLPAAIKRLQRLGGERDDLAVLGGRRQDYVHAAGWSPDLEIGDQ